MANTVRINKADFVDFCWTEHMSINSMRSNGEISNTEAQRLKKIVNDFRNYVRDNAKEIY